MDRHKLEGLTREELVALAGELGIVRPRSLTVPELIDEIVSRTASSEREKARSRGWLGRARSLLASVIERGLHLPDVAKALRSAPATRPWPVAPPPLATMTLAEIYAAQGHLDKALQVLDEILAREPEHADARSFRQRLDTQSGAKKKPETQPKREEASPPNEVQAAAAVVVQAPEVENTALSFAESAPEVVETNVAEVAAPEPPAQPEVVAEPAVDAIADMAPATELLESEASALAVEPPVEAAPEPSTAVEEASPAEEASAADSFEDQVSDRLDSYDRPSIEELPLPERYNVDEIVGIAVDPMTVYVYWEVRPIVLARAHARSSEGAMVVRVVSVTPSWDGPIVEQRDLPIDALYGDAYVRGLRPGSNVRIGVGWLAHGLFAPFAIGDPVATPRREPAFATASTVARWMPQGAPVPVESGQTAVSMLANALEQAVAAKEGSPLRPASSAERQLLGERWPTFDLGSRGLPAESQKRTQRSTLGGSSELGPGGASDVGFGAKDAVGDP